MELWLYKIGTPGQTILNVPEIAGHQIKGRVYRDGVEYRPTGNGGTDDPSFMVKEFKYDIVLGKLTFAFEFYGEPIDIPYDSEENII